MLLYLLSSDELRELLERLGYRFTPEQIPNMVDYYVARTSHGSTLSGVVHSWVLARANRDRALEFFQQVLNPTSPTSRAAPPPKAFISPRWSAASTSRSGASPAWRPRRSHRLVTAMAGISWCVGFPIHYRGHHWHLRVSGRGAEISVDPRDAPRFQVECRRRVETLAPGSTIRFSLTNGLSVSCRTVHPGHDVRERTTRVDGRGSALIGADRPEAASAETRCHRTHPSGLRLAFRQSPAVR